MSGTTGPSGIVSQSILVDQVVYVHFLLRIQPIDATHALNLAAGVS